jgi:Fe2+ transport system protein FeoA
VVHVPLAEFEPARATVERVSDRDPEALRYLEQLGLVPGRSIDVESQEPFGGPVWVRVGRKRHAVGRELAGTIYVSAAGPARSASQAPSGSGKPSPANSGSGSDHPARATATETKRATVKAAKPVARSRL